MYVNDISNLKCRVGQVLQAVYVLAHGLHKTLGCTSSTCNKTKVFEYRDVFQNMINSTINVPDVLGDDLRLDENGELAKVCMQVNGKPFVLNKTSKNLVLIL